MRRSTRETAAGPAVIDGRMIGLVFSKLSGADNIGYIIPMEEIELFLKDVGDGRYDGKPVFIDDVQTLENETLRQKLKLDKKTTGVMIRNVAPRTEPYPLSGGDVIIRIGDHAIDNMGMVRLDRDRLFPFRYLIQRLAKDNKVGMTAMRNGKEIKVDVPVGPELNRWLIPYLGSEYPSYFIYGPIPFTEVTDDYVQAFTQTSNAGPDGASMIMSSLYAGNPMFTRYGDRTSFAGERLVIVGHPLFSHKISKGYRMTYSMALAEVNGVRIRNLKHLVEFLRDNRDEYAAFRFHGKGSDNIVLKRADVAAATEEILSDNGIREQGSGEVMRVWREGKK